MSIELWKTKYKKLNPNVFTTENSACYKRYGFPPYKMNYDIEDLVFQSLYGTYIENEWIILGWTDEPPFKSSGEIRMEKDGFLDERWCAILFENTSTGEQTWWHYP